MKMQIFVICVVLLCSPTVFGSFLPEVNIEFAKYRDDCIGKIGLTNTDVINKIKSRNLPEDGSANEFAVCMLQTYHILNADSTINPNVSSYYLVTDYRKPSEVAEECVPKSGSIDGKEAMKIFKCLKKSGIVVLPY